MNYKGDANIQGMIIGALMVGAFFSIMAVIISGFGNYDTSTANFGDLQGLMTQKNLSADIDSARGEIDSVTVDKNLFDYFIGIFDAVLKPFKTIYNSAITVAAMIGVISSTFMLLQPLKDLLITVFWVLIIVGIVLIKFYLGRNKR